MKKVCELLSLAVSNLKDFGIRLHMPIRETQPKLDYLQANCSNDFRRCALRKYQALSRGQLKL